ncbi:hypothetical protein [Thermospira aquatica]|uniref:Uncharacterized protein n=1 Tax=Thermospira aquatica TaxID=2828656 RepID=A0AAX3BAS4_9SPIR|nr:hypothetical protein [Thermospira aquatica]URA09366.1 hypothetical protein KDW03_07675 [Thermospira aquatica]
MEVIDVNTIKEKYPYLNQPGISVESAMRHEDTICITLSLAVGKLIEIVDNYDWQCVFDRGIDENTEVFTCIAKKEKI